MRIDCLENGGKGRESGGGDVCRKVLSSWGALWNFFTHTHTHIKGWLQKGGGEGNKGPEHYVLEDHMQKL